MSGGTLFGRNSAVISDSRMSRSEEFETLVFEIKINITIENE